MNRRDRDPRVRQTRDAIVDSFNELVLSRPYDGIQVADIIDEAGVGRSTFYEHFRNKDQLLRHSVSAVLGALADAATDGADPVAIQFVLEHFLENRRSARALLNEPSFSQVARQHAELIEARLSGRALVIPPPLAAAQLAAAQLAIIRAWLDRTDSCTPAALARAIHQTTRSALAALLAPDPGTSAASESPNGLSHRSTA